MEDSRRGFIKWSLVAGAALGVSRSVVSEVLEKVGGQRLAYAAAENPTRRSISLIAGTGGLAWFTLLWPQPDVALAADPALSWHKPGAASVVPGTRNLVIGPDTPFASMPAARQMTCFTAGANDTHKPNPPGAADLGGRNIYSVIQSLQAASPSVIPMIAIGGADVGTAPGTSRVTSAAGIVDLFNSAASRVGGLLESPSNAQLYKAHYEAFAQLNRAATRATNRAAYQTANNAAQFLGTNLAAKLSITPADTARYGIDGGLQSVAEIGRAFIVAVKAFKLGLTNSIVLPAFNDDPHTAFTAGGVNVIPPQLKKIFDGLMTDLTNTTDDITGKALADDTVITITGDTPKSCLDPRGGAGWNDGTPGNTNVVFVYGAGDLKPGWFGSISRTGVVKGFDGNAKDAAYDPVFTGQAALASAAYAIVKRDDRALTGFSNIRVSDVFGNPKTT